MGGLLGSYSAHNIKGIRYIFIYLLFSLCHQVQASVINRPKCTTVKFMGLDVISERDPCAPVVHPIEQGSIMLSLHALLSQKCDTHFKVTINLQ